MNQAQMGLFIVYGLSVFFSGIGIYAILDKDATMVINRGIYIGESFLLGSIFFVGELLVLSLLGLYKPFYLWAAVILNYLFLFDKKTRRIVAGVVIKKTAVDFALLGFILLLIIFIYRNCYFMVDVDSLTSYMFTQKVWLTAGTSLVGNATYNSTFFTPQFDILPSALGIALFPQETLFPQLINLSWRMIALLLIFGYASYRFNRYYGLAAAMFVALNDHFFFSGTNKWVLINGAVIALMFAAAYNFWEARQENSHFRFALALIFLFQLMSNKYQVIYILMFFLALGVLIQQNVFEKIKKIIRDKRCFMIILISLVFMSLWYVKNFIVTGNPVFPVLAGKFKTFGFTAEQGNVFYKVGGGISPDLFLKYMSYLFVWPGINAAKVVIVTISFLPLFLFLLYARGKEDKAKLMELFFWLGLCVLAVMGTSLACHWEPRYHRYPIALMAFSAVISLHFILTAFGIRNKFIIAVIMLLIALKGGFNEGYKIIRDHDGFFIRPSIKENAYVLLNKIHTDYAVGKVCPQIGIILSGLRENNDKINNAAWDVMSFSYPFFLLPQRPIVSPWHSTTIKWDSYKNAEAVVNDLKRYNIEWIMQMRGGKLIFTPIEEYAQEAIKFDKHPGKKYSYYDLPPELSDVYW